MFNQVYAYTIQIRWHIISILVMLAILLACDQNKFDCAAGQSMPSSNPDRLLTELIENESAVDCLVELAEERHLQHDSLSQAFASKALEVSQKLEYRLGEAKSRYWLAWHLGRKHETAVEAITESLKSVALLKDLNNPYWLARAYELTGSNYFYREQKDSAIVYLHLARKTVADIDDRARDSTEVLAEVYDTFAWVYDSANTAFDSVKFYLKQSISLNQSIQNQASIADAQMFLGSIYGDYGQDRRDFQPWDSARPYLEHAILIFDSLKQVPKLAEAYLFYGRWYIQGYYLNTNEQWFAEGIANYHKVLEVDSSLFCDTYNGIAYAFLKKTITEKKADNPNWKSSQDSAIHYYKLVLEGVEREANRSCLDDMAYYLADLCKGSLDCDTLMYDIAHAYQSLHDQDMLKLRAQEAEFDRFQQQEQNRKVRIQQKQWMWIGGVIVFFILVISLYLIQRQRIRYLDQELKMKMQALRAQMNPHFISNSLNAIEELIHDKQAQKAADYLIEFSRLCRMVLNHSRYEEITLQEEIESLKYILSLEQLRLPDKLKYAIEVDPELESSHIRIPAMLIQPYVENAIWHGIYPKEGIGQVKVIIRKKSAQQLECIIEDDGVGRAKSLERKKQSVFNRKSWGMQITEERIDALSRLKGASLSIEDLFDEKRNPGGTRVSICLNIS